MQDRFNPVHAAPESKTQKPTYPYFGKIIPNEDISSQNKKGPEPIVRGLFKSTS